LFRSTPGNGRLSPDGISSSCANVRFVRTVALNGSSPSSRSNQSQVTSRYRGRTRNPVTLGAAVFFGMAHLSGGGCHAAPRHYGRTGTSLITSKVTMLPDGGRYATQPIVTVRFSARVSRV